MLRRAIVRPVSPARGYRNGIPIDDRRLLGLLPSPAVAFGCRFQLKRYLKNSGSEISPHGFTRNRGRGPILLDRR